MKKKIKIFNLILFFVILFFSVYSVCYSFDLDDIKNMEVSDVSTTNSSISKIINYTIGVLQVVGTGISIIVVTLIGLKYVMASSQEKADIKKQAVPIVIGCVLLFSAVNIVRIIADYGEYIGN